MGPTAPRNPSERSQVDGHVDFVHCVFTSTNRELATNLVTQILIGAQYEQLSRFTDGDDYARHNSNVADGLSVLQAVFEAIGKQGITMEYTKLHRVVAECNFVLTQSEGVLGRQPTAYYDLFRVENGKIVEHWDVIQAIPPASEARNGNGMFKPCLMIGSSRIRNDFRAPGV